MRSKTFTWSTTCHSLHLSRKHDNERLAESGRRSSVISWHPRSTVQSPESRVHTACESHPQLTTTSGQTAMITPCSAAKSKEVVPDSTPRPRLFDFREMTITDCHKQFDSPPTTPVPTAAHGRNIQYVSIILQTTHHVLNLNSKLFCCHVPTCTWPRLEFLVIRLTQTLLVDSGSEDLCRSV